MTISFGEAAGTDKTSPKLSMTERLSESDIGTRALKGALAIELYGNQVELEQQWSTVLKELVSIFDGLAVKKTGRRSPHFAAATLQPIIENWLESTGFDGESQPSEAAADFCAILSEVVTEVLAGEAARNDPRLAVLHNILMHIHQEISRRHQPERYRF